MSIVDYSSILGKRVKVTQSFETEEGDYLVSTGFLVGYVTISPSFTKFSNPNEILFLEDGFEEPDYITFDCLEVL